MRYLMAIVLLLVGCSAAIQPAPSKPAGAATAAAPPATSVPAAAPAGPAVETVRVALSQEE